MIATVSLLQKQQRKKTHKKQQLNLYANENTSNSMA